MSNVKKSNSCSMDEFHAIFKKNILSNNIPIGNPGSVTETLIRVVADQVISDMVDSVHLRHEGPVMRVQCQLVIWIGHIRIPKGTFYNFL